jgi:WD40 repeat protein
MRSYSLILCSAIGVLLLSGCRVFVSSPSSTSTKAESGQPLVVSPSQTETQEKPLESTDSFSPKNTSTPKTFTPLPDSGPYLAILNDFKGRIQLYGSNGEGPKIIDFPSPQYLDLPALSPAGNYAAYYSGDLEREPYDFALNILRTSDCTIMKTIRLLSADYPDNFQKEAEALLLNPPDGFSDKEATEIASALESAFYRGITTFAWSPDGKQIAFSGEMDGPSSDLYTYDIETDSILHLTDGPTEIGYLMAWSPDGQWIVHQGAFSVEEGFYPDNYVAARGNASGTKKAFSTGSPFEYLLHGEYWRGWISENLLLVYEESIGGDRSPQILDIRDGSMRLLWKYVFDDVVWDPERDLYYVTFPGGYSNEGYLLPGTYQVDIQNVTYKPVMDQLFDLTFLGGDSPTDRFVGVDAFGSVRYFDPQSSYTSSRKEGWEKLLISPNKRILLLNGAQGVMLTYWEERPHHEVWITKNPVTELQWSPDSKYIALESDRVIQISDVHGKVTPLIQNPDSLPWQWIAGP